MSINSDHKDVSVRIYYPLLVGILFIAAALRFWNIDFFLPLDVHLDEMTVMGATVNIAIGGVPHFYNYPSLYMYLSVAVGAIVWLFGRIFADFPGWIDFWESAIIHPTTVVLIMRSLTASMGIAIVLLTAKITELFRGRIAALCAALLSAVTFILVKSSHRAMTDTPMAAMVCLAVLFAIRIYRDGSTKDYILAGIFSGLAASMKYNGGIVLLAPVLAHIMRMRNDDASMKNIWKHKPARWTVRTAIIAFALTTPGIFLESVTFIKGFGYEVLHMQRGHLGYENAGNSYIYHLTTNMPIAMGLPVLIASIVGLIFVLIKKPRVETAIFLAFPVLYFLTMGGSGVLFLRYLVPLAPFVLALAAIAVFSIANLTKIKSISVVIAIILCITIVVPTAYSSVRWNYLAGKPPTTALLREYIYANVPMNAHIAAYDFIRGLYGTKEQALDREPVTGFYYKFSRIIAEKAPGKRFEYAFTPLSIEQPYEIDDLHTMKIDYYILDQCFFGRMSAAQEIYKDRVRAIESIRDGGEVVFLTKGIGTNMEWDLRRRTLRDVEQLGPDLSLIRLPVENKASFTERPSDD